MNSRNGSALSMDGVEMRYGAAVVLSPLSLTVDPGESLAIVGPSGAGKTTLLRLIAGTLTPTAGSVELHGKLVAGLSPGPELSSLVGMVAQQFDLVPNLSALHNVLAGRLGTWGLWRSLISLVLPHDKPEGISALERVGIADRAHMRAGRLSGGEQQRVAIARVLVQDPAVVLADEPLSSLDPARSEEVLRLLVSVTHDAGKTLVASLHDVVLARAHFGRIAGLRNGAVQFDLPSTLVTESMLAELYDLEGLRTAT